MKKVIIIGSGIGGLTAGVCLAKDGFEVTVIEKHFMAGGYATNFTRKDNEGKIITFDVSLHGIGNLNEGRYLHKKFKELGIFDKVKANRKKEVGTFFYKDIQNFDIPDSFEEYKQALIKNFPEEKLNIENLFNFLKDLDKDMEENVYKYGTMPKHFQDLQNISLYDFLKRYTNNKDLIEVFSFLWGYYGLPAKKLNALYYLLAWLSYHIGGTYYLEGGGGKFTKALQEIIEENKGKIIFKQEVVKLNTKDNKLVSVTTQKGETFEGDIFILNGCPISLLENIDNYSLVENYIKDLNKLEKSISISQLYIATDCIPQDFGFKKADLFYSGNITSDESYELILNKNYENLPILLVNYNILDETLNKEHGFVSIAYIDIYENWAEYKSEEYKAQKTKLEELLLNKFYELFPKAKGHVVKTELGTPLTMKRYTNNLKGSIYGFAQDLKSSGFNRNPQITCIENVYLSSAWTQPGGGYEGAFRSGLDCAKIIKEKYLSSQNETTQNLDKMSPSLLMSGMVQKANKAYAKNLNVTYRFNFTDINETYFVKVNQGKITLEKNIENPNVEINCTYENWYKISTKELDGSYAFRQGLLKVKGDLALFMHIPNLFNEGLKANSTVSQEKKLFKATPLIPITIIPFILYWIVDAILPNPLNMYHYTVGFFGILFPLLINSLKPKHSKELTLLESTTILSFTVYLFTLLILKNIDLYFYFELILPLVLILSCIKEPVTAQYSKWEYPDIIVNDSLFKKINVHITLVWIVVLIFNFIIAKILFRFAYPSPLLNLTYLTNIIFVLFTIFYPKKILNI